MNQHRHLAIVAGVATLLASMALSSVYESSAYFGFIFDSPNWFLYVAAAIASVVAASIGARALRAPIWVQPVAGAGALLIYVTVIFGGGFLGIIPTRGTFSSLGDQISFAFGEIAELSAPVPVHRGLLLLAVIGVGAIAVIVDFLAVGLRRASLAGLPLLALYAVPVSIDREGMAWWTFALGAIGYLWLLVTDQIERVERWGRPFRAESGEEVWATTPLGSTGRWVGGFGIAVAVLVPVMLPGLSTAGWFGTGNGGAIGPGTGRSVETINPITQLKGQLTERNEVELLRLRTNDPRRFYLRLTTLDQFGTNGWTQRGLSATPEDRVNRGIPDSGDVNDSVPTREQETSVEIRAFSASAYLPVYSNPSKINARGDWRWDKKADTAFSTRTTTKNLRYSFESERVLYDSTLLQNASELNPEDSVVAEYTGTNGGAEPEAQRIANDLVAGKTGQYAKVVAINQYFSPANGFVYSTQTEQGTTGSDLRDFLENKSGYCEQYASAMAYLVRAAGIPARVAIGFGYGESAGDYVSITNKDAHAWVEVYFAGFGWVPFDPTPAGGTGRTGNLAWTEGTPGSATGGDPGDNPASQGGDQNPSEGTPATPNDDPDLGESIQQAPRGPQRFDMPVWTGVVVGPLAGVLDGRVVPEVPVWLWWLLGIAATLAVCSIPALWRIQIRRSRLAVARSGNPIDAAHAAWDEIIDTLSDLGMPAEDSDTPRTTARRLASSGLDAVERHSIEVLAVAEERARYAPPGAALPVDHARRNQAAQRVQYVQVVCRALTERASTAARLRGKLLSPSLMNRNAQTLSRWGEAMSVGMGRARSSLRRRLIPARFRTYP
jgi:transglutaminase-like putative cysteine protease